MDDFLKKIGKLKKKKNLLRGTSDVVLSELSDMARSFMQKPAVKANLRHFIFPKKTGVYSVQKVKASEENADWIESFFKMNLLKLNRIAIDGLPGSGKSTLAEALSTRLKLQWISLDYQMPDGEYSFNENQAIYEHHRLLRTQDHDVFDAILFMDLPVETIKTQIIARGEGAVNIELFDFELMQKIGKMAFELAKGQLIRIPRSQILMKVKPKGGFELRENLGKKLLEKRLDAPNSLTQEEKLFLLVKGVPQKGLSGYHKGGQYARELFENIMQKMKI
jgi:hypothetical protein